MAQEQRAKLERIAGLTAEDARREILQRVEDEARTQAAALVRDIKEQARKGADRRGAGGSSPWPSSASPRSTPRRAPWPRWRCPSDEMKGRIIGREGRNIRAFETATGVDVIIDDTPDTVIISCFDPIRREVARRALEALIQDGRIHPGRIEEVVAKVQKELETQLVELGEQAAYDTGIHGLHPELIKLIGRMRYRTSYGQNIYDHSKEVAWLAGMMAAELHLDVTLAKRGGLLHDVGKVLTHDDEGTHVELGVEVARRYGESAAGDQLHPRAPRRRAPRVAPSRCWCRRPTRSAARGPAPGARRSRPTSSGSPGWRRSPTGSPGVEKCNVIQAGREVRVVVTPRADRRRRRGHAVGDHRPQDRERAPVSGADQGRRHSGDPSSGLRTMTARILDGVALGKTIRAEVAAEVARLAGNGRQARARGGAGGGGPGERGLRAVQGQGVPRKPGCTRRRSACPPTISEADLLAIVDRLNADPKIHGILVQLPLPKHIDSEKVLRRIDPAKDVDGFHPVNVGKLVIGRPDAPSGRRRPTACSRC